ncbi:hypothetical protein [Flavilitoribacter nigricans]|uniref:Uncharacterized protein n=1 Tax=Flavilitoribacter nigricans (strain ATCC 23147 / DSM 23189 / NBRC 102662 / NCIMB 1420 / SS-2) TaxID=1122177 RepID=A0A2D0NG15_FLAN2|nr:hypothetical protein [Flavilitoribacter nigricans]PHN07109.1 hypothetical protein CRP01_07725 [Flavilitoribacter nigricans DSM 23189 = NBRC 102662]
MTRLIILLFTVVLFYNFSERTNHSPQVANDLLTTLDTVPFRVNEALIRELSETPKAKTWRDSGYYFQMEKIFWQAIRLGTTQSGDAIVLASFSSADPSSLRFQGQAVFRFDPRDVPDTVTPSRGMRGEATVAFPQDVLFCPSPSQEVGLGQNDPYFPLYLTGQITGVNLAGGEVLTFETLMSVQLRDLEITL